MLGFIYNPTLYPDALDAAKDALGIDAGDVTYDRALGRRLAQTAIGETFRPYHAAYLWLAANPQWAEDVSSPFGSLDRRGSVLSLPALAAEQAAEDARLELSVPAHLKLSAGGVPGPVLTGWQ